MRAPSSILGRFNLRTLTAASPLQPRLSGEPRTDQQAAVNRVARAAWPADGKGATGASPRVLILFLAPLGYP